MMKHLNMIQLLQFVLEKMIRDNMAKYKTKKKLKKIANYLRFVEKSGYKETIYSVITTIKRIIEEDNY